MIDQIYGKTGDGKSLYGCKVVLDLLENTNAVVITNIAMKMQETHAYLVSRDNNTDFDLHDRLRLLEDDEPKAFWEYRSWSPAEDTKFFGKHGNVVRHDRPVHFIIDESHEFFGNKMFDVFPDRARTYIKQHRKLGDNVTFITHDPDELHIKIRQITNQYVKVKNEGRQVFGMFKGRDVFVVKVAYRNPGGSERVSWATSQTFPLDKAGVAKCYDTAAGVGIRGAKADKGYRPKGKISIYWAIPMVVGALCLVGMIPWLAGKLGASYSARKISAAVASAKKPLDVLPALSSPSANSTTGQVATSQVTPPAKPLPELVVKGLLIAPSGKPLAILSNGRRVSDQIRAIFDDRIELLDGTVIFIDTSLPTPRKPVDDQPKGTGTATVIPPALALSPVPAQGTSASIKPISRDPKGAHSNPSMP